MNRLYQARKFYLAQLYIQNTTNAAHYEGLLCYNYSNFSMTFIIRDTQKRLKCTLIHLASKQIKRVPDRLKINDRLTFQGYGRFEIWNESNELLLRRVLV